MPDAPNTEPVTPAAPEGTAPSAPAPTAPVGSAPKWDGDFDPERAARLVENLRTEVEGLKAKNTEATAKLSEYEQAQMSEAEKAAQRAASAEAELAKVRRELAVSAAIRKHGLSDDDAEWLSGETAEEIDAKAAKLAQRLPAKPAETAPLPATLPVPGHGGDPAATRQLTREEVAGMSSAELLAAYRAGRMREIGGK